MPWGPSVNLRSLWFSTAWFFSQWNLAVYGDNREGLLASRVLLNMLQYPGQTLQQNYSAQNVSRANVEKPVSEFSLLWRCAWHLSINSHCPTPRPPPPPHRIKVASGSVNVLRPVGCTWIKAEQPSVVLEKSLRQKSREITWHVGGTLPVCMP